MSKQVKEVLQEQRIWHEDVTTRFQPQQGFEDLVFTSKTNRPIHESNIRSSIEYIVDRINAQNPTEKFERFTPHCLRHTFATRCFEKGMTPRTVQEIMGHSNYNTTVSYTHVLDDIKLKEAERLGDFLDNTKAAQRVVQDELLGIM